MRKYIISFTTFTILFLSTSIIRAQSNFEGKIKFKITYNNEVTYLDYYIKDENLRMEMGKAAEAVFIKNGQRSLVLMPEEKMYMDLDNSLFDKLPGMTGMEEDDDEEVVEEFNIDKYKTGKIMTLLGYECHQWIMKDEEDEDEVEAWVTHELGNFMLMQSPMGSGYSPGWSSSMKNRGYFPILVITRDENGEENSRFEATEINEQGLNIKLFIPPTNFTEMKIPRMDNLLK